MTMTRVNQAGSLVFLAVSIYVLWETSTLDYLSSLGPGPGFFPLWLGIAMAGLSVAWFIQTTVRPAEPMEEGYLPDRGGVVRIASVLVSLTVLGALLEVVGFQLASFAFLLFLLVALGRQNLILTFFLSAVGSLGTFYLFKMWLHVPLPTASIPFLASLGL